MIRPEKIYLEITNECNLSCAFCPAHKRAPSFMAVEDFSAIVAKLKGNASLLYFHVKGEPLLHPELPRFIDIANDSGLDVIITTNGTLLEGVEPCLEGKINLRRLNVSLQSLSCFPDDRQSEMLRSILASVSRLQEMNGKINPKFLVSLRLWTSDRVSETARILCGIENFFGMEEGSVLRDLEKKNGSVLRSGLAVHAAETFEWPSMSAPDYGARGFCRALRDQAGILVDGTVVPCCLDGDGILSLGNILSSSWDEIMDAPRSRAIYKAFSDRIIEEPLCRRCGYRTRFGS